MESITKYFKVENDPFFRKGEAVGESRGEARGKEIGKEIGKLEGRKENAVEIAIEMIKEGFQFEQIERLTKLTIDEIKKLHNLIFHAWLGNQ